MSADDRLAQSYLENSTMLFSSVEVESAVNGVAKKISASIAGEEPLVVAVMGGAIVFAGMLLPKLSFPLTFDFVQASRYHNQTQGQHLVWGVEPKDTVINRTVLLLDDILDEGHTLRAIYDKCMSLGAKQVKIAVLVEKQLHKQKPISADYVGLNVPDKYVFGCGMDVYGWWRNLPEIRALN